MTVEQELNNERLRDKTGERESDAARPSNESGAASPSNFMDKIGAGFNDMMGALTPNLAKRSPSMSQEDLKI